MAIVNMFGILISISTIFNHCNSLEVVSPDKIKGIYFHIDGHFGPSANSLHSESSYNVVSATPDLAACTPLSTNKIKGNVVLILRGASIINDTSINPDLRCRFTTKVYYAQESGAIAVIIGNNVGDHDIVPMYDDTEDHPQINIPSLSVSHETFKILHKETNKQYHNVKVKINDQGSIDDKQFNSTIERWITAILSTLMLLATISLIIAGILSFRIFIARLRIIWMARQRRLRIDSIPTIKYSSDLIISQDKITQNEENDGVDREIAAADIDFLHNQHGLNEENMTLMETPLMESNQLNDIKLSLLHNETCNVCLEDFIEGESIKLLRCKHGFHDQCIKSWIVKKGKCPVCIRDVFLNDIDDERYM